MPIVIITSAILIFAISIAITPVAAIAVMVVMSPLRALIETEAPGALPVDIGLLTAGITVAGWFGHRLIWRRSISGLASSPVFIAVLLFAIPAALSLYVAQSPSAWLSEWLKWVQIGLLIVICLDLLRGPDWQWLLGALVIGSVANALVGIYQFLGGSGALHLLINDRFFRAFGTFGQPNPFGGYMGLLAPVAVFSGIGFGVLAWMRLRERQPRVLPASVGALCLLGGGALLGLGVILSWSRGAWLGLIAALIASALVVPRRWWQSLLTLALIGGASLLLIGFGLIPASLTQRLSSAFEDTFAVSDVRGVNVTSENYAVVERLAHWQAAVNMATEHPWLGVGLGNYEVAYAEYRLLYWKFSLGHAHNYYLNVLAETGIIGLAGYLAALVSLLVLTWRARRHPDIPTRFAAIGLFGTWVYLTVHSLTDNLYVNNLFLHVGILLGILAVIDRQTRAGTRFSRHE